MSSHLDIVDIHTHLWPADWGPSGARKRQTFGLPDNVLARIVNPEELVRDNQTNGVALAVVTTTVESLFGASNTTDQGVISEVNDWLSATVASRPGLAAFATVDAFAGKAGALEAERAITKLGLSGLVIDSAHQDRFLNDPAVRPTLELAAFHQVPVFVHPVSPANVDVLIAGAGKLGNSIGRGLMNGVAFLSILEAGLLSALPNLNLIFATLGLGAIVQAARGGAFGREAQGERPNVYFDTMGEDPRIIRVLTDFFGAERVLAGTDWPILGGLSQASLSKSLAQAGLSETDQRLVAGGNARRLLAKQLT